MLFFKKEEEEEEEEEERLYNTLLFILFFAMRIPLFFCSNLFVQLKKEFKEILFSAFLKLIFLIFLFNISMIIRSGRIRTLNVSIESIRKCQQVKLQDLLNLFLFKFKQNTIKNNINFLNKIK